MGTIYQVSETGAITSPSDLATDYIKRSRATLYGAANVTPTTIASAGIWQSLNGIASSIINQYDFSHTSNFTAQYVGAKTMTFNYNGNASISSAIAGGSIIGLAISIGALSNPIIPSANYTFVSSNRAALPFSGMVVLNPGDFIVLKIYSSVAGNVTITELTFPIFSV